MDNKRKNELGRIFIFSNKISAEEFEKVNIQELVFLIFTMRVLKEKNALNNHDYDGKIIAFTRVLIIKLRTSKELYIAYDKNTKYPYIDFEERVWIFSQKEFADNAVEHFNKQETFLEMKKLVDKDVINEFGKMHYIGIEKFLIDNGEYTIEMKRNEILPSCDYSNVPAKNIPVINPKMQFAMIKFFQNAYSRKNYANKAEVMRNLEEKMLEEVINAKYLVPIKLENNDLKIDSNGMNVVNKGNEVRFSIIKDKNGISWIPAFTDWYEFDKAFDKKNWKSSICNFQDILLLSENLEGAVINCSGLSIKIDDTNKDIIKEFIMKKSELK